MKNSLFTIRGGDPGDLTARARSYTGDHGEGVSECQYNRHINLSKQQRKPLRLLHNYYGYYGCFTYRRLLEKL